MKKWMIVLISLVILVFLIILGFFINSAITGRVVGGQEDNPYGYAYTKAICNKSNFCQDNIVSCSGEEVVSVVPITGAFVQFGEDWEDPRSSRDRERLC